MQLNLRACFGSAVTAMADLLDTVTRRGTIYVFTVDNVAAFEKRCEDRGLIWERDHATFRVSLPPTHEDLQRIMDCGIVVHTREHGNQ